MDRLGITLLIVNCDFSIIREAVVSFFSLDWRRPFAVCKLFDMLACVRKGSIPGGLGEA